MTQILRSFVYICVIVVSVTTQRDFDRPSAAKFYNEPYSHSRHLQKRGLQADRKIGERRLPQLFNSLDIPEECKKQGYCENVPNYPTEVIKNLIRSLGDKIKFQLDKLDNKGLHVPRLGESGSELEHEMCDSRQEIIRPKLIKDLFGNWYTVINLEDDIQQEFRITICQNLGSSCNGIANIPEGYSSSNCKQEYIDRMMIVLDNSENLLAKTFKLPSCCSCVLKSILGEKESNSVTYKKH